MKFTKHITRASVLALGTALCAPAAMAQDAAADDSANEGNEIIVTGSVKATNSLDASISVTAVDIDAIENTAPRGLAEVFRLVPGIRSEASAGGGNTNIGVRGIPISTGGAKFVQLQEDGLPIMLFGDFDFAPADGFYKSDLTLSRVEAVRGGSASTLTTNGPGAIINLISKSDFEGASFSFEKGIGYNNNRVEAEFGTDLGEGFNLYAGGHYQLGGDARETGYDAIKGGQFRVSLKKDLGADGFIRVWGKLVDKKDATFLPQAMAINAAGEVTGSIPGLPAGRSIYGQNNRYYQVVDGSGVVQDRDLADGFNVQSQSIGMNLELDLGAGITLTNAGRYANISGDFIGHFTHNVADADTRLAGAAATFFNGDAAGTAVTSASLQARNGNPFITEVANFDVELEDMSNFANDLRLTKSFDMDNGSVDITAGYFFMTQNFKQDWHWNQFLTETSTNAAMIDVAGQTENGILGYNKGFGWNGNNRNYDLEYTTSSPFAAVSANFGNVTVDGSLRYDRLKQQGVITGAAGQPFDVNGDGTISAPEADVSINQGASAITRNDFTVDHMSYSLGVNYRATDSLSFFARYSKGASFNGERQAFSAGVNTVSGALQLEDQFVDVVKQAELGVKYSVPGFRIYATLFDARTEESNSSVTAGVPVSIDVSYKSRGLETEFLLFRGPFNLSGALTYTDAEVTDFGNPAFIGNTPRRQAKFVYSLAPSVEFDPVEVGFNVVGTSKSFGGFNNVSVQPGYATVGAFVNFDVTDNIRFSLNANNLFNTTGVTEVEDDQGRIFDTDGDGTPDIAVGRSIGQRTLSAKMAVRF
ncbi:MAG: TonB-dependent receptor [Marinomonas sp.]|uniref:TonB-dependent receptor n=1 Tax=Alphaproteobacteria TaxID=28211 RepID=UPI003263D3EF